MQNQKDNALNIDWFVGDKVGVLSGPNPVESPEILGWLERVGFVQVVTVRPWPFTLAWQVANFRLRNFMVRAVDVSSLSAWDYFRVNEFCVYELAHGRRVPIWFEDDRVRAVMVESIQRFFEPGLADLDGFVSEALATQRDRFARLPKGTPQPTGCRYCHEGLCLGDLVCHATTVESAGGIVKTGKILSACRTRGVTGEAMVQDPGNAPGDPADYFEYVMWAGGNCTAVDKLVLERALGYVPDWDEFERRFQPAVRFFFRSEDLHRHPRFTLDGIHAKIHRELELDPWLILTAIPEGLPDSDELIGLTRRHLPGHKVAVYSFSGLHYKDWAHKVYQDAKARSERQTDQVNG